MQCVLTTTEYDKVVLEKVVVLEHVARLRVILQHSQLSLGRLAVVQLIVVARLEVDSGDTVRVDAQVNCEDLERDVIVVKLVIAKRDIYVKCVEILVL